MAKDEGQDLEQDAGEETEEITHDNGEQESRLKALESNTALTSLLADADIQAVLAAKRAGKTIKITEASEGDPEVEEKEEDPAPGSDLADDDPLKETLKRIGGLVDTKLTKGMDKVLKAIESQDQRLKGLEGVASGIQQKEVSQQVQDVQKKYKDFPAFKAPMMALAKQFPGADVEDLYLLAKKRAGKLKLDVPSTESERPTNQPRRPSKDGKKPPVIPPGRKGFDELLERAFETLELDGVSD